MILLILIYSKRQKLPTFKAKLHYYGDLRSCILPLFQDPNQVVETFGEKVDNFIMKLTFSVIFVIGLAITATMGVHEVKVKIHGPNIYKLTNCDI